MKQWGNKEGRQVIWQLTQKIEFLLFVFNLTAWKVEKTTAHVRLIFEVQKLLEALLKTQNYTFLSKYFNYIL